MGGGGVETGIQGSQDTARGSQFGDGEGVLRRLFGVGRDAIGQHARLRRERFRAVGLLCGGANDAGSRLSVVRLL